MNYEHTSSYTEAQQRVIETVPYLRRLLTADDGHKNEDTHSIGLPDGMVTIGYDYATFEHQVPNLAVDMQTESSAARGVYTIDCRQQGYDEAKTLRIRKFDQQLRSMRDATEEEVEGIAQALYGIDETYIENVHAQARAERQQATVGSRLAKLFGRNR